MNGSGGLRTFGYLGALAHRQVKVFYQKWRWILRVFTRRIDKDIRDSLPSVSSMICACHYDE